MRGILRKGLAYSKPLLELSLARFGYLFSRFEGLYKHVLGLVQELQVYVIKGLVKDGSHTVTTVHIGYEVSAHQLASAVYSRIQKIERIGTVLCSQIKASHLTNADITSICAPGPCLSRFQSDGYFLLPMVSFSLNLLRPIDQIIERTSGRRRRDIRKLQRFGYSYTVSRCNEKGFDLFYWKMYLPYTKKRFQKAAHFRDYLKTKVLYKRNCGILFVRNCGKPVAGILFQIRGRTIRALSMGVYDGDNNLVRGLAGQAALLFLIKWAKTQGLETLDYGSTMPFFRDGVFTYKKEWGMLMRERSNRCLCSMRINRVSKGSLSFLQRNPFIFSDRGRMKGVVFMDHRTTGAELEQILSDYFVPGLDSLIIVACFSPEPKTGNVSEISTVSTESSDDQAAPLSEIYLALRKLGFNVETHEFVDRKLQSHELHEPLDSGIFARKEVAIPLQR